MEAPDVKLEDVKLEEFCPKTVKNYGKKFQKIRGLFPDIHYIFVDLEFLHENFTTKNISGKEVCSKYTSKGSKAFLSDGFVEEANINKFTVKDNEYRFQDRLYVSYKISRGFFDLISSLRIESKILPERVFLIVNNVIVYQTHYKKEIFSEPFPLFILVGKNIRLVLDYGNRDKTSEPVNFMVQGWTLSKKFFEIFGQRTLQKYYTFRNYEILLYEDKYINFGETLDIASNLILIEEIPVESPIEKSVYLGEKGYFNFRNYENIIISDISSSVEYKITLNGIPIYIRKFLTNNIDFRVENLYGYMKYKMQKVKNPELLIGKTIVMGHIVIKNYKTFKETTEILRKGYV